VRICYLIYIRRTDVQSVFSPFQPLYDDDDDDDDDDDQWLYVVCVTGVEVRDSGFVIIQDSEVSNSGSQGLVAHAGALGYIARRSLVLLITINPFTADDE